MNFSKNIFFWSCSFLFLLTACKKDAEKEIRYDQGILIANRGLQNSGEGSLSYYDPETSEVSQNIFQSQNEDKKLANIQSMYVQGGKVYIVEILTGKVKILDQETLSLTAEIEGFERPRHFIKVGNNKAYVSQWGADGFSGSIKVVNLLNNTIVKTIPLNGPEEMLVVGATVYATISGGFGTDYDLAKISVSNDAVIQTITGVGEKPFHISADKNNAIWVLCSGFQSNMPDENRSGQLTKIVNDQIVQSFELSFQFGPGSLIINKAKDKLYYRKDQNIFAQDISNTTLNLAPFISRDFINLGINPSDDQLIGLDAGGQFSPGKAFLLDKNGISQHSFDVGIVPISVWAE
ncbi:MAG: YncE family protein [Saprospiraceae bacterium]